MAITGSGSLAISFFVFVISAAFLPKGEFFSLSLFYVASCARPCLNAELQLSVQKARGVPGEVVVRLRSRCAQISASLSDSAVDSKLLTLFSRGYLVCGLVLRGCCR